jgi:hypothetical protein
LSGKIIGVSAVILSLNVVRKKGEAGKAGKTGEAGLLISGVRLLDWAPVTDTLTRSQGKLRTANN